MTTTVATRPTPLLKRALWLDAAVTGGVAAVLATAAGPLAGLLGLPEPLLRWVGIILLPGAALVAYWASQPVPPAAGVWTLIAVNALWAVDSVALLFTGWIDPNPLGVAFILAQTLAVVVFAELEYIGLRRT